MYCKTTFHPRFNTSKGLVLLSEFDIENLQQFQKELPAEYNIAEIERATFITTRSESTNAFIVTFDEKKLPYSLYIPGERSDTRVLPFNNLSMT